MTNHNHNQEQGREEDRWRHIAMNFGVQHFSAILGLTEVSLPRHVTEDCILPAGAICRHVAGLQDLTRFATNALASHNEMVKILRGRANSLLTTEERRAIDEMIKSTESTLETAKDKGYMFDG